MRDGPQVRCGAESGLVLEPRVARSEHRAHLCVPLLLRLLGGRLAAGELRFAPAHGEFPAWDTRFAGSNRVEMDVGSKGFGDAAREMLAARARARTIWQWKSGVTRTLVEFSPFREEKLKPDTNAPLFTGCAPAHQRPPPPHWRSYVAFFEGPTSPSNKAATHIITTPAVAATAAVPCRVHDGSLSIPVPAPSLLPTRNRRQPPRRSEAPLPAVRARARAVRVVRWSPRAWSRRRRRPGGHGRAAAPVVCLARVARGMVIFAVPRPSTGVLPRARRLPRSRPNRAPGARRRPRGTRPSSRGIRARARASSSRCTPRSRRKGPIAPSYRPTTRVARPPTTKELRGVC